MTWVGQTEANLPVTLTETGATTTADGTGQFSFGGVSLALGPNVFHVQATDAAGNVGTGEDTITRIAPDQTPPAITASLAHDTAPDGHEQPWCAPPTRPSRAR